MKYLKKYKIPFSGLTTGKHNFDFDIDDDFFACFEHSIVKKGKLTAIVEMQKQENMLIVGFNIDGEIQLNCDVCLQQFTTPIHIEDRVLVKFYKEDWDENSEEIIVLSPTDYELDISNLLYEFINVSVPHYIKCSELGEAIDCDPDMLERLEQTVNEEDDFDDKEIDPRWEALKNIKKN